MVICRGDKSYLVKYMIVIFLAKELKKDISEAENDLFSTNYNNCKHSGGNCSANNCGSNCADAIG